MLHIGRFTQDFYQNTDTQNKELGNGALFLWRNAGKKIAYDMGHTRIYLVSDAQSVYNENGGSGRLFVTINRRQHETLCKN